MNSTTMLKIMKFLIVTTFIAIIFISFSSLLIMVGFMDLVATFATYIFAVPFLFIFLVILSAASLVISVINMHSSSEFEIMPTLFKY